MSTAKTSLDEFFRNTIGFDPFAARVFSNSNNYPPHNIEQVTENLYRVTIAVAGFKRDDIEINVHRGVLNVVGHKTAEQEFDTKHGQYLYQGIALRNWERSFKIGDHVEVVDASLEDGLLTIDLERHVPEAHKPKLIAIR